MKNKLTKLSDGKTYLELHDPVSASVFVGEKGKSSQHHKEIRLQSVADCCFKISIPEEWWRGDDLADYPLYIPMETVKEVVEHKEDEPCIAVDGNGFPYFGPASWTNHDGTHHNLPLFHLNLITITQGDTNLIKEIINYE